jgi:hypothetical protein
LMAGCSIPPLRLRGVAIALLGFVSGQGNGAEAKGSLKWSDPFFIRSATPSLGVSSKPKTRRACPKNAVGGVKERQIIAGC